jgi:exonuclease III
MVSQELMPKVVGAEVHMNVMGSDHCPVSITLEI